MKTSELRKIIKEEIDNTLNESTSYKQFQILIGALSKYKNTRAGEGNPVNSETYNEIEDLIRLL
jgi:hypothetical protein